MLLCTVSLPLQSHLGLPDTAFFFSADNRNICIQCRTIKVAQLFSYTGEDYEWLTKEEGIEQLHLAAVSEEGERVFIRQVHRKTNDESFSGGVIDLKKYTLIQMSFEIEGTDVIDDEVKFAELKKWVSSIIQRFVDLYRMVSQESDVTGFQLEEVPIMDVWIANEYKFTSNEIDAKQDLYTRIWDWSGTRKTNYFKKVLPEQAIHLFGYLLKRGVPLRLFEQLLLECKEQSQARGQHELAIVNAGTAFEAFLKERLTHECEAHGITQLPFGRKNAKIQIDYKEAIEKGNVREDLLEHVEMISAQKIKGGTEYTNWFNHAYKPRNEIIHQGKRGFIEDNAGKAYMAVAAYIDMINKILVRRCSV